jgi:hypothetical protein
VISDNLCLSTNLTSSELAAWVQAIGSILAILGSVWIAVYQTGKQRRDALALEDKRRRNAELDAARSVAELARRSLEVAKFIRRAIPDVATVHRVAEGDEHLEIYGLEYFETVTGTYPLQTLPPKLVRFPYLISSCLRQVRVKIGHVLRLHDQLTNAGFDDLFNTLRVMETSLQDTSTEIADIVRSMEHPKE